MTETVDAQKKMLKLQLEEKHYNNRIRRLERYKTETCSQKTRTLQRYKQKKVYPRICKVIKTLKMLEQ